MFSKKPSYMGLTRCIYLSDEDTSRLLQYLYRKTFHLSRLSVQVILGFSLLLNRLTVRGKPSKKQSINYPQFLTEFFNYKFPINAKQLFYTLNGYYYIDYVIKLWYGLGFLFSHQWQLFFCYTFVCVGNRHILCYLYLYSTFNTMDSNKRT